MPWQKLHRSSIRDCDVKKMPETGWKMTWELIYVIVQFRKKNVVLKKILEIISPFWRATGTPCFSACFSSLQVYKNVELADSVWTCVCLYHANFYGHQQKRELLLRIFLLQGTLISLLKICSRYNLWFVTNFEPTSTVSHVCFIQISNDRA